MGPILGLWVSGPPTGLRWVPKALPIAEPILQRHRRGLGVAQCGRDGSAFPERCIKNSINPDAMTIIFGGDIKFNFLKDCWFPIPIQAEQGSGSARQLCRGPQD